MTCLQLHVCYVFCLPSVLAVKWRKWHYVWNISAFKFITTFVLWMFVHGNVRCMSKSQYFIDALIRQVRY
jgi:hypothetical protein